jgi:hypothetical protein
VKGVHEHLNRDGGLGRIWVNCLDSSPGTVLARHSPSSIRDFVEPGSSRGVGAPRCLVCCCPLSRSPNAPFGSSGRGTSTPSDIDLGQKVVLEHARPGTAPPGGGSTTFDEGPPHRPPCSAQVLVASITKSMRPVTLQTMASQRETAVS